MARKNFRKAENYTIGLDLGTASVGWAACDDKGELYRFNGKTAWGSRIFPSAETAAETRGYRGQRRRYDRRRQRLNWLQEIFAVEMSKIDPEFFIRINQARLLKEDRRPEYSNYRYPLFNESSFDEKAYYKKFPTIYHLRQYLMKSEQKEDIRLIYLAFHNIVKCRGNFLYQDVGDEFSAKAASPEIAAQAFALALADYAETCGVEIEVDIPAVVKELASKEHRRSEKRDALRDLFKIVSDESGEELFKDFPCQLAAAILGYETNFAAVFGMSSKNTESAAGNGMKFSLGKEDKVNEFLECCPDECLSLFESIQALYSAFVLSGILKHADGGTLSDSMTAQYEKHRKDLEMLKKLINRSFANKDERKDTYHKLFQGTKDAQGNYVPSEATGYTAYIIGEKAGKKTEGQNQGSKTSQDKLYKMIKDSLKTVKDIEDDSDYKQMLADMNEDSFLAKQKTRNNGAIPYQFHLEEMRAIIAAQSKYYPFLVDEQRKIESLVKFRIPYYVGPLNSKYADPSNPNRSLSGGRNFSWSKRLPGKENEKVYPWNFDEVIDKDASAEAFILRMTGKCTYLYDQDVLPKNSLLYQEFCVLNELNSARWCKDGEKFYRFNNKDCHDLIEEVFKKQKSVKFTRVKKWLVERGFSNTTIRGTQAEDGFVSQLSSYNDFCGILETESLSEADIPMIEEIIRWNTLFEDREILKRRIENTYGSRLSETQIKKICKKRYSGWGRLSRELLEGLKMQVDGGARMSIIAIMRDGDEKNVAMNLMEILNKKEWGFSEAIAEHNKKTMELESFSVDELPGSPSIRRSINQSLRIIDELIEVAGTAPTKICMEFTRGEDESQRGKRTQSRYKKLNDALQALESEAPELFNKSLLKELKEQEKALSKDRMLLYFSQNGRCMYSWEPLDINNLERYQIDHIIPQSYVKDDSLDNRVLVCSSANQRKLDNLLLETSIIQSQKSFWQKLHSAKLISDKKYNNLIRTEITNSQIEGFINRQLVETSQIIKMIADILRVKYPDTKIVPVKAALTSNLRDKCGFIKCRDVNDYHHAHDAYLAAQIDRFVNYRYPKLAYGFDLTIFKRFIRKAADDYHKGGRVGSAGFIVESFMRPGVDYETGEIFEDAWDAQREIADIRSRLSYKDCFISRMPEETSGSFWDATIYSPKDPKKGSNLEIPLKNNKQIDSFENHLDPQKYGGQSGKDFAYFFIFVATDSKGKQKVFFEGVPLYCASRIKKDKNALREYAEEIAKNNKCVDARIIKKRVLKYQKIVLEESELYITGGSEARPARPLVLDSRDMSLVDLINECLLGKFVEGDIDAASLKALYCRLKEKAEVTCPKLARQLKLGEYCEGFDKVVDDDKSKAMKVIKEILAIIGGKTNMANLEVTGNAKCAGHMQPTYANKLGEVVFIDTSVTGLFERRYKLGI